MPTYLLEVSDPAMRSLFLEPIYLNNLGEIKPVAKGATGFYYRTGDSTYLITARHVVTARRWGDEAPIGRQPNYLRVHGQLVAEASAGAAQLYDYQQRNFVDVHYDVPLYADVDGMHQPLWLESPLSGKAVDVVALPVDVPANFICMPWALEDLKTDLAVADELFVVGYPYGLRGITLPLWVRGTIASQPTLGFEGNPLFLIDSRTRMGQSGAPVVHILKEGTVVGFPHAPKGQLICISDGDLVKLVGVYTGRINPVSQGMSEDEIRELDRYGTDLGFVWWGLGIELVCKNGLRPDSTAD